MRPYQILGYGYAWWSGDPLPELPALPGFRSGPTTDVALIAEMARLDVGEVCRRLQQANQVYVGYLYNEPIAYGWSAAATGAIDDLSFTFTIPPGNRYLWDFVTLPPWRGRGVYPCFLQSIINQEQTAASRFWIGHTADNDSSRQGIIKAGFQTVEALVMLPTGALKIVPLGSSSRAQHSPMGHSLGLFRAEDNPAP